ncbi:MAG: hypothetical protein IPN76_02195 [Saprospiraceae bacterium]|nr:hypothetical protein [Saprospiraceae bacterium]
MSCCQTLCVHHRADRQRQSFGGEPHQLSLPAPFPHSPLETE